MTWEEAKAVMLRGGRISNPHCPGMKDTEHMGLPEFYTDRVKNPKITPKTYFAVYSNEPPYVSWNIQFRQAEMPELGWEIYDD